jgi:hypothetical protein
VGEDRGRAAALARLEGEYRQRFGGSPPAGDPPRAKEQAVARGANSGKSLEVRREEEDNESPWVEDLSHGENFPGRGRRAPPAPGR